MYIYHQQRPLVKNEHVLESQSIIIWMKCSAQMKHFIKVKKLKSQSLLCQLMIVNLKTSIKKDNKSDLSFSVAEIEEEEEVKSSKKKIKSITPANKKIKRNC